MLKGHSQSLSRNYRVYCHFCTVSFCSRKNQFFSSRIPAVVFGMRHVIVFGMERFNLRHLNANGVHKLPLMFHDSCVALKSCSTKDKTTITHNYTSQVNVSRNHYFVPKPLFVSPIKHGTVHLVGLIFLIAIWHFSSIKHPLQWQIDKVFSFQRI